MARRRLASEDADEPRTHQVNVTLPAEAFKLLRARGKKLKIPPSTLAGELLERALAERSDVKIDREGAPASPRRSRCCAQNFATPP